MWQNNSRQERVSASRTLVVPQISFHFLVSQERCSKVLVHGCFLCVSEWYSFILGPGLRSREACPLQTCEDWPWVCRIGKMLCHLLGAAFDFPVLTDELCVVDMHVYRPGCSFPVIAIPEWVSEAAGVRWFCKLQYNTIYDLVSSCNMHILTK